MSTAAEDIGGKSASGERGGSGRGVWTDGFTTVRYSYRRVRSGAGIAEASASGGACVVNIREVVGMARSAGRVPAEVA